MTTTRAEREDCQWQRDRQDEKARAFGHDMEWRLAPTARRRGCAYYFIGDCRHCAANMHVGASWTSCGTIRDARKVRCSGPGTAVLTEVEAGRASELVADAVAEYGRSLRRVGATPGPVSIVIHQPPNHRGRP